MKKLMLYLGLAVLVSRPCNAWGHVPPPEGLIRPGEGVSGVNLGSHFSNFEAVFPRHARLDEDMPDTQCGAGRVYHWLDIDKRANGIYAYLKDDQIYQLSIQTPRFSLPNGLKVDAPENRVKTTYPHGRAYVLLGSHMEALGGRDLIYWVDQKEGLAFELYWNKTKKKRLVRAIDIFRKGADYRPEGCISPPQQWRELE
jgi:hypothetical protein